MPLHDGGSVNRSQIDILVRWKHMIFEPGKKTFISRHILHQHWYTCPIALPVRRNPQHWSHDCCLSHFRTWSCIICDFRTSLTEFLDPVVNRFMRQTLPTVNRKHFFMNILCIKSFCSQRKRTTEHCSSVIYFSNTVAILITETSLWTWACAFAT
jgi:hypothetical protein